MTTIIIAGLLALLVGAFIGYTYGKATAPKPSNPGGILGLVQSLTGIKI